MLFLSRIEFRQNDAARFLLDDRERIHAALAAVFDGDPRILWVLEPRQPRSVIAQSHQLPDWTRFRPAHALASTETKSFEPRVQKNVVYVFRLCANVARTTHDDTGHHKRRAILDTTEQLAWLERHLTAAGAESMQRLAFPGGAQRANKTRWTNTRRLHGGERLHNVVIFSGTLRVIDATRFGAALEHGIGPAKAFGYGMLQIAPII